MENPVLYAHIIARCFAAPFIIARYSGFVHTVLLYFTLLLSIQSVVGHFLRKNRWVAQIICCNSSIVIPLLWVFHLSPLQISLFSSLSWYRSIIVDLPTFRFRPFRSNYCSIFSTVHSILQCAFYLINLLIELQYLKFMFSKQLVYDTDVRVTCNVLNMLQGREGANRLTYTNY